MNEVQVTSKDGKVYPHEIIKMTVGQFATLRSFRDQFDQASGTSMIDPMRVKKFETNLMPALAAPQNLILLNMKGDVLQGNHRLVATKRNQLLPDRVDPNFEFYVVRLTVPTTPAEDSRLALRGNLDPNRKNYRQQLFGSQLDISTKIMKPTADAVLEVWPDIPDSLFNQIVPRLGAFLNRNPGLADKLKEPVPVYGYDFSVVRRYPEANISFYEADTYVNLIKYKDDISGSVRGGLLTMKELFEDGTWVEKFGRRKTNLAYILTAMSMRGEIRTDRKRAAGEVTIPKIVTAVKNSTTRIANAMGKFNNGAQAKAAEDTILLIFQEQL